MKLYYLLCVVNLIYFPLPVYGQSTNFCKGDADCTVKGTTCQNGLCVCAPGKVLSSYGGECLDIAPGIGFPCTESTQCTPLISGPAGCNQEELCSCATDHVFFNNTCVKYSGFNETCTKDTPCYDGVDLFAMECKNDLCECSEGYYTRGNVGCRLAATANEDNLIECFLDIDCRDKDQYCKYDLHSWGPLGSCTDAPSIKCKEQKDCEILENSYCSEKRNNTCFCNDGFNYNKTTDLCEEESKEKQSSKEFNVPQLKLKANSDNANLPCTVDNDCKKVQNSFCAPFRQKCTCQNSFIFDKYSGNCVRALGSECLATEPKCGVKYAECNKNNICQCPKYFIYSAYGDKCIKPTREFSSHSCGSDENCYAFGPYTTCTKANATIDIITTCNCKSPSTYDEELQYCVPLETGKCKNDCEDKLHSECENGVCKCQENYIEEKLQCLPNLGATCSLAGKGDCVVDFATCHPQKKICECNTGYFQTGPRECLQDITNTEDTCVSDIQCFNLLEEGGICVNETCSCEETYVLDEEDIKCIRKRNFGEECESAKHCSTMLHTDHVKCLNGKCSCDYDYKYSEEHSQCLHNAAKNPIHGQLIFIVVVIITTLIFFL